MKQRWIQNRKKNRKLWRQSSSFVVFDDMLVYNQKAIDPFFTAGQHIVLDVYYLSQSYFDLQKRIIKYKSKNNYFVETKFERCGKPFESLLGSIWGTTNSRKFLEKHWEIEFIIFVISIDIYSTIKGKKVFVLKRIGIRL